MLAMSMAIQAGQQQHIDIGIRSDFMTLWMLAGNGVDRLCQSVRLDVSIITIPF